MWLRLASSLLVVLAVCASAWAVEGWTELKRRTETVKVGGQQVALPLRPSFRTAQGTGLEVRLVAELADFQQKLPAILNHWAGRKSKKCGIRWRFPDLSQAKLDAGRLVVAGKVRFEQRACAFGTNRRVWRESADFSIGVIPAVSDNRIKFLATVEKFDLGKSILKDFGADAEVQAAVQGALAAVLSKDDLSLEFPKEIRELKPALSNVALRDLGGGNAGLEAEAKVTVDAAALAGLVKLLME